MREETARNVTFSERYVTLDIVPMIPTYREAAIIQAYNQCFF